MDNSFNFLNSAQAELLDGMLTRRRPTLLDRIRRANAVSRTDAEQIVSVINEELNDNLDDDWEPTEYGQAVSAVLAQFNAARVNEWP